MKHHFALSKYSTHISTCHNNCNAAFTLAEGATHVGTCPNGSGVTTKLVKCSTHVDTCPNNRKTAFTLAEVLITLGVIGVVAAMTMPVLITKYQKFQTVNKLKRVYTVLNQALKLSEAENGEYANWESGAAIGANVYFEKYWKPYLNVVKFCKTYADCGYSSNQPYTYLNGNLFEINLGNDRILFILSDGTLIIFTVRGSGDTENSNMFIDLNAGRGENRLGKDVFIFTRDFKGQIYPHGYHSSISAVNNNCSHGEGGLHCAAKIMKDGWKIEDDYPW